MSADYNGTDKSKRGSRHRPARSSPGKGSWPRRAVLGSSRAAHRILPQACAAMGSSSTSCRAYSVLRVTPRARMLQHLPGGVKHTCLKHLERLLLETYSDHWKQGATGADFFLQMVYFPFQKLFPLYGGTPEKTGRFSSCIFSKRDNVLRDFWAVEGRELRVRDVAKPH